MGCLSSEGSYDCSIAAQFKAQSEKPPAIFLRGYHDQELQVLKLLEHPGQGLSTNSSSAALCTSITHPKDESLGCITTLTDKLLQKKTLRKKSWPMRQTLLLCDQCSDAGRWVKADEGYICMRRETDALFTVTTENWHEETPPDMHSRPKKCHWGELANQAEPH